MQINNINLRQLIIRFIVRYFILKKINTYNVIVQNIRYKVYTYNLCTMIK